MAVVDDLDIPPDAVVWRALIRRWVTTTAGRTRPTSDCFDSESHRYETSGFLVSSEMLSVVREIIPQAYAFGGFPVRVLRNNGFGVERRPKECPGNYSGDFGDHVVVGPVVALGKKEYVRRTKGIVRDPEVSVTGIQPETAQAAEEKNDASNNLED